MEKLWNSIKDFSLYIVLTTRDAIVGHLVLSIVLGISTPIILVVIFKINFFQDPDSNTSENETPTSIDGITITDKEKSTVLIDVQSNTLDKDSDVQSNTLDKDSEGNKRKTARTSVSVQPKTRPPVSKTQTPINAQMQNEIKKALERARLVNKDYKKLTREAEKIKRDQKEMSERIERLRKLTTDN